MDTLGRRYLATTGLWYQCHIPAYVGRIIADTAITEIAVKVVNASELPDWTARIQDIERPLLSFAA